MRLKTKITAGATVLALAIAGCGTATHSPTLTRNQAAAEYAQILQSEVDALQPFTNGSISTSNYAELAVSLQPIQNTVTTTINPKLQHLAVRYPPAAQDIHSLVTANEHLAGTLASTTTVDNSTPGFQAQLLAQLSRSVTDVSNASEKIVLDFGVSG